MRSRTLTLTALAALTAGLWFTEMATADDAATRYNQMLARRQFNVSVSPTRTYAGLEPGPAYTFYFPYSYGAFWGLPGWRHERISPRGYERYDYPASPTRVAWGTRGRTLLPASPGSVYELRTPPTPGEQVLIPTPENGERVLTTRPEPGERVLSTTRTENGERVLTTRPANGERSPAARRFGLNWVRDRHEVDTGAQLPRVLRYSDQTTPRIVLPPPSPPPADRLPPPPAYAR